MGCKASVAASSPKEAAEDVVALKEPPASDEREPEEEEEEGSSQCDALFAAPAAAVDDQLKELRNPDALLRAFHQCHTSQQAQVAKDGDALPVPATSDALFQCFLDNAPKKELVLHTLAAGFGTQATHHGMDGFAPSLCSAYNDFWKDPATGERTRWVHRESSREAVRAHWAEFRPFLEQKGVSVVYVLRALALFVETPCEILFQDGRIPIQCPVRSRGWEDRMSLTFDGSSYQSTQQLREAEAKARIENFQGANVGAAVIPADPEVADSREQAKAGGLAAMPVLGNLTTLYKMEQGDAFKASDAMNPVVQVPVGELSEYFRDLVALGLNEPALRKLECPTLPLAPSESLSCVLSCVKTGTKKTLLAEGADLMLVIGNTGAGKSTTINYISGCKIVAKSAQELGVKGTTLGVELLVVQPRSEGGPKDQVVMIGHSKESMTFIPEIVEPVQTSTGAFLTLCDTPGFSDSRGSEINIANAVNTKQTFQRARSVRVLALMNFYSLRSDRANGMRSMTETMIGIFGSEEAALKHVSSIQLAVTHVEATVRLQNIVDFLSEGVPDLLLACAKSLCVIDPLEKHQDCLPRDRVLELVTRLPSISNPGQVFHTYLPAKDQMAIDMFTEPFVHEIQGAICNSQYSVALEKFQTLKQLICLGHPKVAVVLTEASNRMRSAILTLGEEVDRALIYLKETNLTETGLRGLLGRMEQARVLDACFTPETPAKDQFEERMQRVEHVERRMVEERDRQIESAINTALQKLKSEVEDILTEGTGDLFKELDIPKSTEKFRLVRLASSARPEPPSSRLPSLEAIKLACADLEAEILNRPGLYCLYADVGRLKALRGEAQKLFATRLENAVLFTTRKEVLASYEALLADMQGSFRPAIEEHHKAITDPEQVALRSQQSLEHILQLIGTWFRSPLPELVSKMREVLDWGGENLSKHHMDDLQRKLLEKLELLRAQAEEYQEQLKEDERQRKLHELQSLMENKTVMLEDVATHSVELNNILLKMEELGANEDMIRERLDILQKKASAYASVERLQRFFCDREFQQLATLLRDCSRVEENFGGRVTVPVTELKNKFKDLFVAERQKAVDQMKKQETLDSGDLEKFTDLLRTMSHVPELYTEFVKPYEDASGQMQGVPWGAEDLQILDDGCKCFLAHAQEERYLEAARCLVKYRRICSLLREGHFSQVFRAHIQQLMSPEGHSQDRHSDEAGFNIGQHLLEMVNRDSEHPDVRGTAREIIETFPVFSRVNVALFNKIAGGITFESALSRLTDLRGSKVLTSEGEARLQRCHETARTTYDELMAELLRGRSEEAKRGVMDKIVKRCHELAQKMGSFRKDFSSSTASTDVSEMLGNIFAMWSVTSSGDAYIEGDMCVIVQPHPPQILVVLHMLGLGIGGAVKNHIAQVGTGEGKSVCLGILGAFFCLLGFKVNIVCYSPFLSERDQEKFKGLFASLSVRPIYCDISQLCNQVLRENCDVRRLAIKVLKQEPGEVGGWTQAGDAKQESVLRPATPAEEEQGHGGLAGAFFTLTSALGINLQGSAEETTAAADNEPTMGPSDKSVLIIDEVDVFFGEDFYGRFFVPCVILEEAECVGLVEYVWQHRGENLTPEHVLRQPEAEAVRRIFKGMHPKGGVDLLEGIVTQMLNDVRAFPTNNTTSHDFRVGRDEHGKQRVGYLDEVSGVVDFRTYKGYMTAFAYAHSVQNKSITDLSEKANMMGFNLFCGMLPYADLPNFFGLKLGLTGSLQSASGRELEILKTRYHFTRFSLMPSIFEKQAVVETPAVVIAGDARDAEFFAGIREDIVKQRQIGRASLVVFENLLRLEEFGKYLRDHPFTGIEKLFRLTGEESDTAKKEERIAHAARSRHITLITRAFGRGSDFVCRDSALVSQGGLHVIQTFPSELKSEEVQIKGRTCRQNDPGSYRQILFLNDLAPFEILGQEGINAYESWQGEESGARTWNRFIDKQREEVLLERKFQTMHQALQQSEENYIRTKHFIESAKKEKWREAAALLMKFSSTSPREGKHRLPRAIAFVIDRTWEPILDAAISSIESIFRDLLADGDLVGLYGLGEGWLFELAPKGPNRGRIMSFLAEARHTAGGCVLYRSMLDALRCLGAIQGVHRWLVVLSDTVDLADDGAAREVCAVLKTTNNLSMAFIDSKEISGWQPDCPKWPLFRSNVDSFMVKIAEMPGNDGFHFTAADEAGVAEKFQEVASLMVTGTAERTPHKRL